MAEESYKPPESAEELLRRYAAGERDFHGAKLGGAKLDRANLADADLAGADLRGADLRDGNLMSANLRDADLHRAKLTSANLSGTELQGTNLVDAHLERTNLRQADLSGKNLLAAYLAEADLRGANLSRAGLTGANLRGANLSNANLRLAALIGADLTRANLNSADLRTVHLTGSNLSDACLIGANLGGDDLTSDSPGADLGSANASGANFRDAKLTNTNLRATNLSNTNLTGANLGGAILGMTVLLGVDVSPLCDADPPVEHRGPSAVDFSSVAKSIRSPKLKDFLARTGLPELAIEYMHDAAMALGSKLFELMRSTFISYGHEDAPFARRLYEALLRNGVRVFFAPEHSTPGEKIHRELHEAIQDHDRTILVCSRASLDRPWVLFEIEKVLAREARMGGESLLIPIRLDGYVLDGWNPARRDLAQAVRDRAVADFEGADRDEQTFRERLGHLLRALRKTPERLAGMGR